MRVAKKGAPFPSLAQAEMIESLLCFGWIDGRVNRYDEHSFLHPRDAAAGEEHLVAEERGLGGRADRGRPDAAGAGWRPSRRPRPTGAGSGPTPGRPPSRCPTTWRLRWRRSRAAQQEFDEAGRDQPVRRPVAGAHGDDAGRAREADRGLRADAGRGPPLPLNPATSGADAPFQASGRRISAQRCRRPDALRGPTGLFVAREGEPGEGRTCRAAASRGPPRACEG